MLQDGVSSKQDVNAAPIADDADMTDAEEEAHNNQGHNDASKPGAANAASDQVCTLTSAVCFVPLQLIATGVL